MIELDNLYNYCHQQYILNPCQNCPNGQCWHLGCATCDNCLYDIHRAHNHTKNYPCKRILYNYVMQSQSRYASEVVWALSMAHPFTFGNPDNILCCSIGCGPCSEFFGLVALFRQINIADENFTFFGFDISDRWNDITTFIGKQFPDIKFGVLNSDFFSYAKNIQCFIDIMFVNYMLSDIMRYDRQKAFVCIDEFVQLLKEHKIKNLIINDIALFYDIHSSNASAYAAMEYLISEIKKLNDANITYQKYHFSKPNLFQPVYGTKINGSICFKNSPVLNNYKHWDECKSIVLIVRTV